MPGRGIQPPTPHPPCPGAGAGVGAGEGVGRGGLGFGGTRGGLVISSQSLAPKPPPNRLPTTSFRISKILSLTCGGIGSFLSHSPPSIPPRQPPMISQRLGTGKGPQLRTPGVPCIRPRASTQASQFPISSATLPATRIAHSLSSIPTMGAIGMRPDGSLSITTPFPTYAYRLTPPSNPIGSRVKNRPVAGSR